MIISELDLSCIEEIVVQCGTRREAVIPILQAIQRHYHYLPQSALKRVCELTDITPADITGVSTFYTHFRHQPVGRHMIHVCQGTACHVKGAELVHDAVALHLGLEPGHDTDPRGEFTVQPVACLGCCTLAPVMQIDDVTYGRVTPRSVPRVVTEALRAQSTPAPIRTPVSQLTAGEPGGNSHRAGLLLPGPGKWQSPRRDSRGPARIGRSGHRETRGLHRHVSSDPADAIGHAERRFSVLFACAAAGCAEHRAAALPPARDRATVGLPVVALAGRVPLQRRRRPGGGPCAGRSRASGVRVSRTAEAHCHGVLRRLGSLGSG